MKFQPQTKGLVIVYTGEGKGKTTAALGLAFRAVGYGKKVLVVQFGKMWFTGEVEAVKKFEPLMKLVQGGKGFVKILGDTLPLTEHQKAAQEAYDLLYQEMLSQNWDVIVADELVGAVASKLIPFSQLVKLIKDKPEKIDLVLTGHHASQKLIKMADLVTEMLPVKHPYTKGFLAKESIDY